VTSDGVLSVVCPVLDNEPYTTMAPQDREHLKQESRGDPWTARCGAKTRSGRNLQCPRNAKSANRPIHAIPDAWRRFYGPRTSEGMERCRKAPWKHGHPSAAAIARRKIRTSAKKNFMPNYRNPVAIRGRQLFRFGKTRAEIAAAAALSQPVLVRARSGRRRREQELAVWRLRAWR